MSTPKSDRAQDWPAPIVVTLRVGREALLTTFTNAKLFTIAKLNWITAIAHDGRLHPHDKIVGIVIA